MTTWTARLFRGKRAVVEWFRAESLREIVEKNRSSGAEKRLQTTRPTAFACSLVNSINDGEIKFYNKINF